MLLLLPCFKQRGTLLHFQVWRVSTYTKSMTRTDLHCAALKLQSSAAGRESVSEWIAPLPTSKIRGDNSKVIITLNFLTLSTPPFFLPLFFSPFLLPRGCDFPFCFLMVHVTDLFRLPGGYVGSQMKLSCEVNPTFSRGVWLEFVC